MRRLRYESIEPFHWYRHNIRIVGDGHSFDFTYESPMEQPFTKDIVMELLPVLGMLDIRQSTQCVSIYNDGDFIFTGIDNDYFATVTDAIVVDDVDCII